MFQPTFSGKRGKAFRFANTWEQRKLNEIADVYDGVHQTPKYTSSGVRFLSVENIATLESEKYISEADFIRDFKIFPQKGDILMTRIGDIGTAKVIKSDEKYAFYVSLALLKPKHINSDFLCNSIASKNFQKGLKARSLLTAIPLKINKEEIGKVATSFPLNLSEQEKIGSFFNHIESLLTLHQRQSVSSSLPSRCSPLIYSRTLQGLPRRNLANQYPFNQSKRYGNAWNKTDKFIFICQFFITPTAGSLDGFLLYCQNGCAVLQRY
ncbi:restriction endonuclease subunit S [Dakarella massiliensis]|uniref:restriction endonuclease subunit S n=1 Tax=Dakarella massiliensis TaxID=1506471 RepID=UPI0009E362F9|nr:restriction endonuclease subunit S [Dakarella massiliensis]